MFEQGLILAERLYGTTQEHIRHSRGSPRKDQCVCQILSDVRRSTYFKSPREPAGLVMLLYSHFPKSNAECAKLCERS